MDSPLFPTRALAIGNTLPSSGEHPLVLCLPYESGAADKLYETRRRGDHVDVEQVTDGVDVQAGSRR